MTTRCPHCGTAFKVVADQLRVRNGLVRCGVCSRVFDGHACVVDGPAGRSATPPPAAHPDASAGLPSDASPVLSVRAPVGPTPPTRAPVHPEYPPQEPSAPLHAPPRQYTPPRHQPTQSYGPPQHPTQHYGPPEPPARPEHPTQSYGPPNRATQSFGPHEPPAHPAYGPSEQPHGITRHPEPVYTPPRSPVQSHTLPPGPYAARTPPTLDTGPTSSTAVTEPAVLRGREPNRRSAADPHEAGLPSRTPLPARDDGDEEDPYAYREPYAPYRQDNVEDAEQQAEDMALQRDDRFGIYAERDAVEDEEPVFVSIPGEARTRYDDLTDAGMAPPIFMDEDVQRRRTLIARLWVAGCLLGLIALGLQCLYIYRTAIATAVPALRPALEAACAPLGCQVGYARRLERISITASSLQPQSNAAPDDGSMRLTLRVTLRNRYDKPQPWPALMLQLSDLSDTVVARKVLLPENYLPPGTRGPFPAGGEQTLSVPLQVDGLHVNGYQLDKFFP
ncbi:DUF3426 domain-containing protein [Bordetella sp. H567]|uniref:DUF3426 domain-containing protein n=1 Tax=Bordetella sp. H567 TaxID=1697043 RepID=UPI001F4729AB|nr:DUF3426 domain-containing protein [Bordetella sp. H567]